MKAIIGTSRSRNETTAGLFFRFAKGLCETARGTNAAVELTDLDGGGKHWNRGFSRDLRPV